MTQATGSITLPALSGVATATALVGTGSISGTAQVGQTLTASWPTATGQAPIGTAAEVVDDTGVVIASGTLASPPTLSALTTGHVGRSLRASTRVWGYGTMVGLEPVAVSAWTQTILSGPVPIASDVIAAVSLYVGETLEVPVWRDFATGGMITSYSVVSGPSWASINSTTGVLTLTPDAPWSGSITVRGSNINGADDTTFSITATVAEVPVISGYTLSGDSLTFNVDAACTVAVLVDGTGTATASDIIENGALASVNSGQTTMTVTKPTAAGTYYVNTVAYVSAQSPSAVSRATLVISSSGPIVLYEEHFNNATWLGQSGGADIFYASGSLVTTFENTASPEITATGTAGRLKVEGSVEYTEQWLAIPMQHPTVAHDLSFSGAWDNLAGTTASGCFKIRWVDNANNVISTVTRIPASTVFGSIDRNCDYSFTGVVPPAGATKLQIGFLSDGTNGPRWARGKAYIYDIQFKETA